MQPQPVLSDRQQAILHRVKVNAPATMLLNGLLEKALAWSIHPEVGLDAVTIDQVPPEVLTTMAKRLRDHGIKPTIHGPFMDLAPGAIDPLILGATRQRLRRALELASIFSPEHVVFHAYYDRSRYGDAQDRWLEVSLQTWRPLAALARDLNLHIVLENVYEKEPAELVPLLSALASENIGFCFDIGHAHVFSRASSLEWMQQMAPYLAALHLHDNLGLKDDHVAIGRGNIDFASFFAWLSKSGVHPRVTLEPHYEEQLWASISALADLWPWPTD